MKQIQWYPGHMAKTKRKIKKHLQVIDVVLELRDARLPMSSQNPVLHEIVGNTPTILLLNKADLADMSELQRWVSYFENKGIPTLLINSKSGKGVDKIVPLIQNVLEELVKKERKKGRKDRRLRAMILGIPNVGKSSLINRLASKQKLNTEDRPGVTRQTQFIRVGDTVELLDTPGMLWPQFEDKDVALKLALSGAIKDDLLPKDDVVVYGLQFLDTYYPGRLEERYEITVNIDNIIDVYEQIGRRRGCLLPGNQIDYERVSHLVLHDFRHEQFGRLMMDRVEDV